MDSHPGGRLWISLEAFVAPGRIAARWRSAQREDVSDIKSAYEYSSASSTSMNGRWSPERPDCSAENPGRLANLDQVAVGVANIGADLAPMIFRLGEELGALGGPLSVNLLDV